MLDIILLCVTVTIFVVMIVIIVYFSDRSRQYKTVSAILIIPALILEVPHFLLPDPTNLIDITVHIAAGLAIFMFVTNLRFINLQNRHWAAFFLGVITIISVEIFLSLLEIFTGYPNPIGIDSLEDILWNTFGGMIGLIIHYEYGRQALMDNIRDIRARCKLDE